MQTEFRFNIGGVVDPMFGCLGFDTESEHTFKMYVLACSCSRSSNVADVSVDVSDSYLAGAPFEAEPPFQ